MSDWPTAAHKSIIPPSYFPSGPSLSPYSSLVIHLSSSFELLYEIVDGLALRLFVSVPECRRPQGSGPQIGEREDGTDPIWSRRGLARTTEGW